MLKNPRHIAVISILLIILCSLIYRAYVVTFSLGNQELVNLKLMSRTPISLQKLNKQAEKLEEINRSIEDYTFAQIRLEISETSKLIGWANRELEAQNEAWVNVRGPNRK